MLTLKKICYIQWLSVIYRRQYITARRMPTQCRRSNSRTSIPCTSRAITESSWERIVLRTKVPGSESSTANSLHGAKVPRSESSRERKFQGANWPGSYWNFRSRERIGPGAKRLWIVLCAHIPCSESRVEINQKKSWKVISPPHRIIVNGHRSYTDREPVCHLLLRPSSRHTPSSCAELLSPSSWTLEQFHSSTYTAARRI